MADDEGLGRADPAAECRALRSQLAELQASHARLLQRLATTAQEAERWTERAKLHALDASRQAADAATARKELARVEAHRAALIASTSWRLTTPLRSLAGPLRRLAGRRPNAFVPAADAPETPEPARRRAGPPPAFPLPDDLTAHPALLPPQPDVAATVSVVIPTWNAGRELPWLIRKLQAQRGLAGVEIITVDSGSTDGTAERAAALGCRVLPIEQAAFSHSAARNLGAAAATGDLLLFMVQDAYPIGDDWLAGLARCLLHPAREQDRLAALSCAEYSRADSEMMYDWMAHSHYVFLGCGTADRVGRLTTLDHDGLRRQGQLSDVACLIGRELFQEFQFQGRYAEDLTLGIRLIEAGHQLGMMSSIRVAHAHNRPAGYYVRRSFVDLVFLAGSFRDFDLPPGHEPVGALVATAVLLRRLPRFEPDAAAIPAKLLERLINEWQALVMPREAVPLDGVDFGYAPLRAWAEALIAARGVAGRRLHPAELRGTAALQEMVTARLIALHHFVAVAWPVADAAAVAELGAAVTKTLAMSLGAQLASCHLDDAAEGGRDPALGALKTLLLAGI